MKQWPEDKTEWVPAEDLLEPLRRSLFEAYTIKRTKEKSISYDGYNIAIQELAVSQSPEQNLTESAIDYHEERGRDILDIVLLIAYQLGIEQGRRLTRAHIKELMSFEKRRGLDNLVKEIEQWIINS
jgi:hypothetical protein